MWNSKNSKPTSPLSSPVFLHAFLKSFLTGETALEILNIHTFTLLDTYVSLLKGAQVAWIKRAHCEGMEAVTEKGMLIFCRGEESVGEIFWLNLWLGKILQGSQSRIRLGLPFQRMARSSLVHKLVRLWISQPSCVSYFSHCFNEMLGNSNSR